MSVRREFGAQNEIRTAWNEPDPPPPRSFVPAAEAAERARSLRHHMSTDGSGRQVEERGAPLRGGGAGLRANVLHRELEGGVMEMLPLKREARDAQRVAEALREDVVKSKINLIKSRIALDKKVRRAQLADEDFEAQGASGAGMGEISKDHMKFGNMLGVLADVDEEVISLRRDLLDAEREARALKVQKVKLDRLSAALGSARLARELAHGDQVAGEMLKLLHVSSRLKAQLTSQQDANPGLKVPHLSEHDRKGGLGGGGSAGGAYPQRLEISLLKSKVTSLKTDIQKFQTLLNADRAFDAEEVNTLVRDYLVDEAATRYRLEVRTAGHSDAGTDCEVYVALSGSLGLTTDRELLHNPDVGASDFSSGSTRFFEIRAAKDLGTLQTLTLWLGTTGAKDSWAIEDIVVYNARTGQAALFKAHLIIRRQMTLTAESLAHEYCLYEVAVTARTEDGGPLRGVNLTVDLFGAHYKETVASSKDQVARVVLDNEAQWRAGDGFDWGGEDGTRLITSEDADGTSGDPEGTSAPLFKDPNEMRFRVRCRFLGAIRSLSLVSVDPPASRWGIHQVAITCLRNQRKSVLLPKKLLGGGARGHGGGEDGWVMLNGARDTKGGGGVELRADKRLSKGAEADMARLQALLKEIPAFELPLSVQEALQDLLRSRQQGRASLFGVVRRRMIELALWAANGLEHAVAPGNEVVAHCTLGGMKSDYPQNGTVVQGGDVRGGDVIIDFTSGVRQTVPRGWIIKKEEATGGGFDHKSDEEVEALLRPVREVFAHITAEADALREKLSKLESGEARRGKNSEDDLRLLREANQALEDNLANERTRSEFLETRVREMEAQLLSGTPGGNAAAPQPPRELEWQLGFGFEGLEPPKPTVIGRGKRVVRVTIVSVAHLPKMDMMGSCDPFCKVVLGGKAHQTKVIKGKFDATFDESFDFEIPDVAQGCGDLRISLYDWDLLTAADEIGAVVLPGMLMSQVARAGLDWIGAGTRTVYNSKTHAVIGKDKQETTITLKLQVLGGTQRTTSGAPPPPEGAPPADSTRPPSSNAPPEAAPQQATAHTEGHETHGEGVTPPGSPPPEAAAPPPEPEWQVSLGFGALEPPRPREVGAGRRVVVCTLVSASHLPKMDTFGSCDPFCKLLFRGKEYTSKVVKNSYDATFDETFEFEVAEAREDGGSLTLTLFDWDRISAADEIGAAVLPEVLMSQVARAGIEWKGSGSVPVFKGSKQVVGKDKKSTEVAITLRVRLP